MVRTELYFGRDMPGKGEVSDIEFDSFVTGIITKELPEGLTLFDAYGQYEDKDGTELKQATKVMIVFHEDTGEEGAAIEKVIAAYRERFSGAKVMRSTSPAEVVFYVD
jgi:Protein of unknown function (DUF3574)